MFFHIYEEFQGKLCRWKISTKGWVSERHPPPLEIWNGRLPLQIYISYIIYVLFTRLIIIWFTTCLHSPLVRDPFSPGPASQILRLLWNYSRLEKIQHVGIFFSHRWKLKWSMFGNISHVWDFLVKSESVSDRSLEIFLMYEIFKWKVKVEVIEVWKYISCGSFINGKVNMETVEIWEDFIVEWEKIINYVSTLKI